MFLIVNLDRSLLKEIESPMQTANKGEKVHSPVKLMEDVSSPVGDGPAVLTWAEVAGSAA